MTRIGVRLVLLIAIGATIGCDRVTKYVAATTLAEAPARSFLADTFRLEYAENAGAFLGLGILAGRLASRSSVGPKSALLPLDSQPRPLQSIRTEKFPYAVAIAGGSLVSLSYFGQVDALADFILGWSAL